jgi:hypothetical protein
MHQGRAIERYAITPEHVRLPVQRQVPRELRDHDRRDQRRRRHAVVNQARRRLGLHHCAFAGPAAITRPVDAFDLQHRRDHVELFAHIFPDHMHRPAAAGADRALGLDHNLTAGQMLR